MKVWNGFGSEHSAKLVMIGRFKDAGSAEKAKAKIDEISRFCEDNREDVRRTERFSDNVMELLSKIKFFSVTPGELEQFTWDVDVEVKGNQVVIKTDELDVSAFMKLMIDMEARLEVFSRHDYADGE